MDAGLQAAFTRLLELAVDGAILRRGKPAEKAEDYEAIQAVYDWIDGSLGVVLPLTRCKHCHALICPGDPHLETGERDWCHINGGLFYMRCGTDGEKETSAAPCA